MVCDRDGGSAVSLTPASYERPRKAVVVLSKWDAYLTDRTDRIKGLHFSEVVTLRLLSSQLMVYWRAYMDDGWCGQWAPVGAAL